MPNFTLLKKTYYFTVVISLNSAINAIATVSKQKIVTVQAHAAVESAVAAAANRTAPRTRPPSTSNATQHEEASKQTNKHTNKANKANKKSKQQRLNENIIIARGYPFFGK